MHGATKALLKTASVLALLSGCLLLPSPASAQFGGGFPGINFRVPYMGGGGGHYRSHRHKVHERRSREKPDQDEPAEHDKSAPQPLSAPIKDSPPPPQGGGSPGSGKPAGGEEPAFSPSR